MERADFYRTATIIDGSGVEIRKGMLLSLLLEIENLPDGERERTGIAFFGVNWSADTCAQILQMYRAMQL